jgi:hypothetical protein
MTDDRARLELEAECVKAFNVLRVAPDLRGHDLTLLFFDYGDKGNVAFKTSLSVGTLADTFETLIRCWRTGVGRKGVPGIGEFQLTRLQKALKKTPEGVGCALLIGRGERTAYIGRCDRADMIRMLENELIPNWRSEAMFINPMGKSALVQQEKDSVVVDKLHAAVAHLPKEQAREVLQEALAESERADMAKSLMTRQPTNSTESALAWRGGVPMPERLLPGRALPPSKLQSRIPEELKDQIFEKVPDPNDPNTSPGEVLASSISAMVDEQIASTRGKPLEERRRLLARFLVSELDALGIDPNAGERRYVMTVWAEALQSIETLERKGMRSELMEEARKLGLVAKMKASAVEVMPDAPQFVEELRKRIKQCVWPPNRSTPLNVEAELMALAYCVLVIPSYWDFKAENRVYDDQQLKAFGQYLAAENQVNPFASNFVERHKAARGVGFGLEWLKSNFAKLEVGHKMAAALCLTDVPDDVAEGVEAPWIAWSLVVPGGLLTADVNGEQVEIARALCFGTKVHIVIGSHGEMLEPDKDVGIGEPAEWQALTNLVLGVCIAIGEPEEHVKKQTSGASKSNRKGGAPDLTQVRFMLSAPIEIDLRDDLRRFLRGERKRAGGGHISVQFLVRGHWKNQVHGPKRSLRKRIWIKPFWKGDEAARVLLRNYEIKGEEPQA